MMSTRTIVFLSMALATTAAAWTQTDYVHYESPQTAPLRLAPAGTRLFAANTADSRLSVFDLSDPSLPVLIAEVPVGLEPVAVNGRTDDEVWVVNHASDSVSVVSVTQGLVVATLPAGDEPCDVVFAGGRAFVSAARAKEVRVFDAITRAPLATIPIQGEHPRALAVSLDGSKVYATLALSGNRTTALPASQSAPQPPPTNPSLPAPPKVASIVDAQTTAAIPYTVLDHDVAEIDVTSLTVSRYFDRTGTVQLGLAVRPGSGDLYVANTDALNLIRFLPNLRGHFVDHRITRVTLGATPVVTAFDLNPGLDYATLPNPAALASALAEPTAMAFHPDGSHLYVAAFGTDRVARVDPNGGVLSFIEVGPTSGAAADPRHKRGPRGLALRADVNRLYVQNRLSNTLSVIDTAAAVVLRELAIGSFDPTPLAIREGRGFLYDAKLSGNGTGSCASCHVDGDDDHLAWDLGDPAGDMQMVTDPQTGTVWPMHPMKGPMVTLGMKGLRGFAPYNWRGDRQTLQSFNAGFGDLMGGQSLAPADNQRFVTFVDSVELMPNPYRNLDGSLPASVLGGNPVTGAQNFQICTVCHGLDANWFPQVTKEPATAAQAMKVPEFREFYKKAFFSRTPGTQNTIGFGGFHDGTSATSAPQGSVLAAQAAFLISISSGTGPAVGYGRTLSATTANDGTLANDIAVLESEALLGDCDLIGKGSIDGMLHGLWFDATLGKYRADASGVGPFTFAELKAKALAGDATVAFLGTPPGTGQRMGVDRDGDGVFDGDEQGPAITSYGAGCPTGGGSVPTLTGQGIPTPGGAMLIGAAGAPPTSLAAFLVGISDQPASVNPGCLIQVAPVVIATTFVFPAPGAFTFAAGIPESLTPGLEVFLQVLIADPTATFGTAATNALRVRIG